MPDISPKTEITVAQIVQDFGDFYLDQGQNMDNLHKLVTETNGTRDAFTIIETNDTILREANVEVTEILQQYQDDFTPKGSVDFKPVQIPLYKMKIDQKFNPHKLQRSWLGFLSSTKSDVSTWPFVAWFMEVYLKSQLQEDLEMKAMYTGIAADYVEGEPGNAINVMDGAERVMDNTADVTEITIGAIAANDDDFVTQIEGFVQAIPEKFRYMDMELNMSRSLRDKFKRGTRIKYKSNYDPTDIKNYRVADAENITVVGRASMQNKSRVWCTPKYNALLGVKGFGNAFEVEKAERKVKIFTEWWMGIGFINGKLVFKSDGD